MQRQHSPDSLGPDRKRRRKVLSCLDCRRRKVQCDRALPACGRCQKAGKADQCNYDEFPGPLNDSGYSNGNGNEHAHGSTSVRNYSPQSTGHDSVTVSREVWNEMFDRLLQQERKIARLETERKYATVDAAAAPSLRSSASASVFTTPAASTDDREVGVRETALFRGKAFKTLFFGATNHKSLLLHVPGIVHFVRGAATQIPELYRIKNGIEPFKTLVKSMRKEFANQVVTDEDLMSFLPDRGTLDQMVECYLRNFESTYRILHIPSFRKEYETFSSDSQTVRPEFLVILLLICACTRCLISENRRMYIANSSVDREEANKIILMTEVWLSRQSQKKLTLANFQIRILRVMAAEVNLTKTKRDWNETSILLTHAMSFGLHRDTGIALKKTTVFDQEMRRRLWATIVEMNVQASVDRGLPPLTEIVSSDCGVPSNVDDDEFDPSTITLPPSRPESEFTRASYLNLSSRSLSLRSALTKMLNEPRRLFAYDTILHYHQAIEEQLSALPAWSAQTGGLLRADDFSAIASAHLRMQLEQFQILLHVTAIRQATSVTNLCFSRSAFLSVTRSVMQTLFQLLSNRDLGLIMLRNDAQRAALYVGYVGNTSSQGGLVDHGDKVSNWLEVLWPLLDVLEPKLIRLGLLQPEHFHSYSLYDMLRSKECPLNETGQKRSGMERIMAFCNTIFDSQDPEFMAKYKQQNSTMTSSAPVMQTKTAGEQTMLTDPNNAMTTISDPTLTDFDPMDLNWAFEDWMFDPGIFPDLSESIPSS